jgi:hypothetical protein
MSKLPRTPIIVIFTITCIAVLFPIRQLSVNAFAKTDDDDRYYLPPASWLRFFSLGYNEAAADLVWVKTLIYFGKRMALEPEETNGGHIRNYLLTAVALDPKFRSLYTTGATFTKYSQGRRITRESIDMAITLLESGIKEFPNDGELWFALGFIHHYEMLNVISEDPEDPETQRHLRLGRYYFARAALMDNAPPYAGLLAVSLVEKWGGFDDMIAEHLKSTLLKETNPTLRSNLIKKLRNALGKAAEKDIQKTEQLQKEWQQTYDFVPFDFFLVLRTQAPLRELIDPLYFTDQMLEFQASEIEMPVSNAAASDHLGTADAGDMN